MAIRTLIADDDAEVRSVLVDIIERADALELVAVAEDAQQAIELAGSQRPDAALLDVKMPGGGARAAREIRASSPDTVIIALSAHEDARSIQEMFAAGAYDYLVKGVSAARLVEAISASVLGRDQGVPEPVDRRSAWGGEIRRLLEDGGVGCVFQPIVALASGDTVGFEALARFESEPIRGPGAWFAEATTMGLAVELELAAIGSAVSSFARLPANAFMALNVSPASIVSGRLAPAIGDVPLDRAILEVTEHAPIADYPHLRSSLAELRRQGVRLAVDDVGAGHASLRHILQLEPDVIKLDVSLTRNIQTEPAHRSLAAALATFAREVDATLIAVGIETDDELEVVRDLGIPWGQGYRWGRPSTL